MIAATSGNMWGSLIVVFGALAIVWGGSYFFNRWQMHHYATVIDEDQFASGIHRAQVVDVRQGKDFKKGHILGARNIPYAYLTQQYSELRSDLPIYLYDAGTTTATQAARVLYKHGYRNLYILSGGYLEWHGKIKKDKYAD